MGNLDNLIFLLILNFYVIIYFIVKDCGVFVVFLNGFIIGWKIIFFNIVIFSCYEGFFLNGFIVRWC